MRFKKKDKHYESKAPEIVVTAHDSRAKDGYVRLKDNILFFLSKGNNKVLQIESSLSGEGKTTCVVNLAVTLANSGKKVIVLDLDLRRPKVHKAFNIANYKGIIDYMLDEVDRETIVKKTEYGVDFINRGKATNNVSMIFTSDKFLNLIEDLKKEYDIILLDCPPVLQVSDYIHISKISHGILFVVSFGKVRRSQIQEAVALLNRSGNKIMGTAITFADNMRFSTSYYRYYNAYYNRYYVNDDD